jgi:flagellar biosynthesis chaperone FliJ
MKRMRTWQRLKMLRRDHAASDLARIVHQIDHQQQWLLQIETAMQQWTDAGQDDAILPTQDSLASSGNHPARQLALEWWLQGTRKLQYLESQHADAAQQLRNAQRQVDAAEQKIQQLEREEQAQQESVHQRSVEELVLARRVHSSFHR